MTNQRGITGRIIPIPPAYKEELRQAVLTELDKKLAEDGVPMGHLRFIIDVPLPDGFRKEIEAGKW